MDYLAICRAVRSESGLSGGGPSSVANQTGMLERIVYWVQDAYATIQQEDHWSFRWRRATFDLQAGVADYLPSSLSVTDLGPVFVDGVYINGATPTRLSWMDWSDFDRLSSASGQPARFARRPDGALVFHPTPDAIYPLRVDYLRDTHTLVSNTDVPLWPDATQQKAIVFGALMMYADHAGDPDAMRRGARGYESARALMAREFLEPITARPLSLGDVDTRRPLLT